MRLLLFYYLQEIAFNHHRSRCVPFELKLSFRGACGGAVIPITAVPLPLDRSSDSAVQGVYEALTEPPPLLPPLPLLLVVLD